jgi:hypothetical protein
MAFLTRDQFLALPLRHEDMSVPGGELRVWELTAAQRLAAEEAAAAAPDKKAAGLHFAARCVGDEAGPFVPPFTVDELSAASGQAVHELVNVAMRLNFATKEAAAEQRGN